MGGGAPSERGPMIIIEYEQIMVDSPDSFSDHGKNYEEWIFGGEMGFYQSKGTKFQWNYVSPFLIFWQCHFSFQNHGSLGDKWGRWVIQQNFEGSWVRSELNWTGWGGVPGGHPHVSLCYISSSWLCYIGIFLRQGVTRLLKMSELSWQWRGGGRVAEKFHEQSKSFSPWAPVQTWATLLLLLLEHLQLHNAL